MRPRIAILLLSIFTIVQSVLSCRCSRKSFVRYYHDTRTVLVAKVVQREFHPPKCKGLFFLDCNIKYTLRLRRVYKGCAPTPQFLGRTARDGSLCGVRLQKGANYLLFVDSLSNASWLPVKSFYLNLCQGNRPWKIVNEVKRMFLKEESHKEENQCMD